MVTVSKPTTCSIRVDSRRQEGRVGSMLGSGWPLGEGILVLGECRTCTWAPWQAGSEMDHSEGIQLLLTGFR